MLASELTLVVGAGERELDAGAGAFFRPPAPLKREVCRP